MSAGDRTAELIELLRAGIDPGAGAALEGESAIDAVEAMVRDNAHPDFETVMVDLHGRSAAYPGVDGLREALTDWITPYETFRLEIDEVIPLDNRLVLLVRQVGRTRHGGVEVDQPSATIWEVQDGQIRRAEFHLDRQAALRSAGLEE